MPAGNTYESIATQTLGSTAATVTFSSIPSTYTDLVLVVQAKASGAAQLCIKFNNTTTPYSTRTLNGNGSAASSSSTTNVAFSYMQLGYFDYIDTTFSYNGIVNIMNYANTTTNKTVLHRGNNAGTGVGATVGMWGNTAAINRIDLVPAAASFFDIGSTFSLYGIASA
jgi:hypothetical protein